MKIIKIILDSVLRMLLVSGLSHISYRADWP